MRETGNNPFAIKGDYKKRFSEPNYNYTLRKANDPATLNIVIDGIEGNFEKILSINSKTDIYALGAYVPKSLESKGMNLFRDLVLAYNEKLQGLCNGYHITYINTELIGKEFSNSEANFHISNKGHNRLANHILGYMYENKIAHPVNKEYVGNNWAPSVDEGCTGMILSLLKDYKRDYNKVMFLRDYDRERKIAVVNEHDREVKVFKKVMSQLENK